MLFWCLWVFFIGYFLFLLLLFSSCFNITLLFCLSQRFSASLSLSVCLFASYSVFQRITEKFEAKDYENQCCVQLQRGLLLGICTQQEAVSGYVGLSCSVSVCVCVCKCWNVCKSGLFSWEPADSLEMGRLWLEGNRRELINTTHPVKTVYSHTLWCN